MKIELKKISFNERMSEETNCFVADLYINGKKVGYVKNDGHGGCTDYRGYNPADNQVIKDAEAYCKTLPKVKYNTSEWENSLEHVIDQLFEDWIMAKLNAKAEKQKLKLMENAIIIGKPNTVDYIYFKQKRKLSDFPVNVLQPFIDGLKAKHCTGGKVILNTNLQALGLNV
jgi:hypothetical protein